MEINVENKAPNEKIVNELEQEGDTETKEQETEEDFNELIEFVKEQKFDRLGVFTYSEEEGTSAAAKFTDDVPQEIKFEREEILMEVQRNISLELNSKKLGNVYKVLVDRIEDDYMLHVLNLTL
jgi:ribosomal protein S12 methylthiotransferase